VKGIDMTDWEDEAFGRNPKPTPPPVNLQRIVAEKLDDETLETIVDVAIRQAQGGDLAAIHWLDMVRHRAEFMEANRRMVEEALRLNAETQEKAAEAQRMIEDHQRGLAEAARQLKDFRMATATPGWSAWAEGADEDARPTSIGPAMRALMGNPDGPEPGPDSD
jgi:hypothetical protein